MNYILEYIGILVNVCFNSNKIHLERLTFCI